MMYYITVAHKSGSDRVVLSLFALGIMFVTGYTVARVAWAQPDAYDPAVQTNVVPHEGTLWADGLSPF